MQGAEAASGEPLDGQILVVLGVTLSFLSALCTVSVFGAVITYPNVGTLHNLRIYAYVALTPLLLSQAAMLLGMSFLDRHVDPRRGRRRRWVATALVCFAVGAPLVLASVTELGLIPFERALRLPAGDPVRRGAAATLGVLLCGVGALTWRGGARRGR
jgi:hypothetical protein